MGRALAFLPMRRDEIDHPFGDERIARGIIEIGASSAFVTISACESASTSCDDPIGLLNIERLSDLAVRRNRFHGGAVMAYVRD